ncbi:hypothetical protein Tco_0891494 [Tanacetum coccineum]|uniref:Uncharacterized protein n=1 Tax=Tanacetum coccineum TaxID=301880 RepID=A0ABQ5C603_9ASTR
MGLNQWRSKVFDDKCFESGNEGSDVSNKDGVTQENTHNSATREPRVNRLNKEGIDRGSGGTENTNCRCKLDFPHYDGSTDPLPWISRYDYYFRHQRVAGEEKMSMVAPRLEDDA